MADIFMLFIILAFFGLSFLLIRFLDSLSRGNE